MSQDYSRILQDPWNDYLGVLLQQGRPLTDADWNELLAQLLRRTQAGTLDTFGPAVVPKQTPDGFLITPTAQGFTIGVGRIYVDGLLAENHGGGALQWDARLAEQRGAAALTYKTQPYLPTPPALPTNEPYLVYIDVWQREVGPLQDESLLEKALGGVDTTARWQTVWQVRALGGIGATTDCATPLNEIPGWTALTAPSAGRLTTATGDVSGETNPCLVPPASGYKGGENQLYRVEVHQGGAPGKATFKWSRDNASVQARVLRVLDASHLVIDSVGRDEVLRFNDGDWIEVLDDVRELNGQPGVLCRILIGGGVDDATSTITLTAPLPAGTIEVDAQGKPTGQRHTRIRRWDQSGLVKRADGSTYADLDAAGSTGEITIPANGAQLLLESGVLVSFSVAQAGGQFHQGDWWAFTARASDASLEILSKAPPRGTHHHFAKLAVITPPTGLQDCRIFWPPEAGCCTMVVHPGQSIQGAIDALSDAGGCICLKAGTHVITQPIAIRDSRIALHGEAPGVRVTATDLQAMLRIGDINTPISAIEVSDIDFELDVRQGTAQAASIIELVNGMDLKVHGCGLIYVGAVAAPVIGIRAVKTQQVNIADNRFQHCHIGVSAETFASPLTVERNTIQGLVLAQGTEKLIHSRHGVQLLGALGTAQCRANRIADCLTGVSVSGSASATVADNQITRQALPESVDATQQPPNLMYWAIELSGGPSCAQGNQIDLASRNYGGVLANTRHGRVCGNEITSSHQATVHNNKAQGPIGIHGGPFGTYAGANGDFVSIEHNRATGIQTAILVHLARGAQVTGNTIVGSARVGVGITLDDTIDAVVSGNVLQELTFPLSAQNGERNKLLDNRILTAGTGLLIISEDGLDFSGNTVDDCRGAGAAIVLLNGDADIRLTRNRLSHCGWGDNDATGIAVWGATANEVRVSINACDIFNTGVSPDRLQATKGQATGIFGDWLTHCELQGNRILYEGGTGLLDVGAEHRAIKLSGALAYVVNMAAGQLVVANGGALVQDNVLEGPGLTHLVEFYSLSLGVPYFAQRFDRVTFSGNRCTHQTQARAGTANLATTVRLLGACLTAVGNHIKAPPETHAMHLGQRPNVALIANTTTGGYTGVLSTVPSPLENFNVIL